MKQTLDILSVIAFVLFHVIVTLPLATVTAREMLPWLRSQGLREEIPDWAVILATLVLMAVAFALRDHVVSAHVHHHSR